MTLRQTYVVSAGIARAEHRILAARDRRHGLQVMTMPELVARLAGGFLQPPTREALQEAVADALRTTELGPLASVRDLPGMIRAAVATLTKAWGAGVDLEGDNPRLSDLRTLERAVIDRLPPSMRRHSDLAAAARARVQHAPAVLGPITFVRVPDLDPCWRDLVNEVAQHVPITWAAGHRPLPDWLDAGRIEITQEAARAPQCDGELCANPRHEAVEALRWARALMARGRARPEEIAIAAADPSDWDPSFQAIAAEANLDLHFVHGRPVTSFPAGQTCAALAEVLLQGLSQDRVRRLIQLLRAQGGVLDELPGDWTRDLPPDAPLLSLARWQQAFDTKTDWHCGQDLRPLLMPLLTELAEGPERARDLGERYLRGRALAIWRKALKEGPAAALDVTLQTLKTDDGLDPSVCVCWMRADDLASAPRRFARLLGLTSRGWPRGQAEDPLLPNHIVRTERLDPVPVPERDRRDFRAILAATPDQVVLSRARRDPAGRLLGPSPQWPADVVPVHLNRSRVPDHAMGEADRLLARPSEFAGDPVAAQATACWFAWHREELTPYDGRVREGHPILLEALDRTQSASSLRKLLRDPIGYLWAYALGWEAPDHEEEPLALDSKDFGNLVHETLEAAVHRIEAASGLARANAAETDAAITAAAQDVAERWVQKRPVPPELVWQRTQESAIEMARTALSMTEDPLAGQRSWPEIPFGRSDPGPYEPHDLPWDSTREVRIPGTNVRIAGTIDRLDLSGDGATARVNDYKTGKVPDGIEKIQLRGGGELQRCLYTYAVTALLGDHLDVDARLIYPGRGGGVFAMDDAPARLAELTQYLETALANMHAGLAVIGPDSESDYNDYAFALPGNAKARYFRLKGPVARARQGDLPQLWEID